MKKKLIILAAATTLVLAGCGKTETTEVTKVPFKEGSAALLTSIDQLKGQLDANKIKDAKKLSTQLEDQWASFEDEVKPKFPELYFKVEKFLIPLEAGLKQDKLDYPTLTALNTNVKTAITELTTAFTDNKGAVNKDVIEASKELQEAAKAYNKYVQDQGKQLVTVLEQFDAAVKSGDLKKAQEAYGQSRMPYERIEPIIETFSELDGVMDARVDDFKNEKDPAFTGYHRIEHLLFVKKNVKDAEPFSARLLEDGKKMQQAIAATTIEPSDFIAGVGELMEEAQSSKITGEEERWSGATVPVIRANVEGAQAIYDLVKGELKKKDAALDEKISKSLAAVIDTMNTLSPVGPTWNDFGKLDQAKQVDLKNKLEALAEPLVKMPGTLSK
ncbi:EfeM/EfeO family lipoprotein [Paenibacillus chondroitinus]|uniref:EfeM/EfeO family lipoprotein n=1 Tax=Paenibacillus chondroitinus TaxID=59842 RepID=A0ABU6DDS1_9BACL|nr:MULTISPECIES: EfeM/EfeO family lipoprotein [Paenibacillus]MCY9657351.1 EfeM/EfeO family lipoprotein [Paenibacillus anseongense]MEB4795910.1 EfeM/EfeO family lipoprotein [Paenibacillus chondroitinus]